MIPRPSLVSALTLLAFLSQVHHGSARPIWTAQFRKGDVRVLSQGPGHNAPQNEGLLTQISEVFHSPTGASTRGSRPASFLGGSLGRRSSESTHERAQQTSQHEHSNKAESASHPSKAELPRPLTRLGLDMGTSGGLPSWFNGLMAALIVVPVIVGVAIASIALCGLCGGRKTKTKTKKRGCGCCGKRKAKMSERPSPTVLPGDSAERLRPVSKDLRSSYSSNGSRRTGSGSIYMLPNGAGGGDDGDAGRKSGGGDSGEGGEGGSLSTKWDA